ncbi:MAG: hypothetical protein AAGF11_06550 [Myxococcota bacterium]
MRIRSSFALCASLALGLVACDDDQGRPGLDALDEPQPNPDGSTPAGDGDPDTPDPETPEVPTDDEPLTPTQVQAYMSRIAPVVAGRSLSFDESEQLGQQGTDAIEPMLTQWVAEPGFAEAIRYLVQEQLNASGEREGVDYELPGNLAAEIAREDLPWSTILTADYCVDGQGQHIECDTGSPYAAGVLATRAYLIANKGRFNLGRAKLMLETFACRIYPMEVDIQIPLNKTRLIPMFQANSADEQTVEEAEGGFGNGAGCYSCHSQFGAHAQLFVKFDAEGLWRDEATGQQDPYNELGRSFDGLYTSHMIDPYAAAEENSQVFGQDVANLREAGEVIADNELFGQCTVKNLVAHAFDLKAGHSEDISKELVESLAEQITTAQSDPSIGDFVVEIFTDERVIRAAVSTLSP